jgi:hypothetical protein
MHGVGSYTQAWNRQKTTFSALEMPGYEPTRYGWTAPGQTLAIADIHRITVASGQWVADVKIPLWRLPVIGGRVVMNVANRWSAWRFRAFSRAVLAGNPHLVGSDVTHHRRFGAWGTA